MPEHVPTTEEVRARYNADDELGFNAAIDDPCPEFDKWLNAERARAWDEGAEHAWQCTGEGANAEYPGNDGEMSFREFCDVDSNPYRKEATGE